MPSSASDDQQPVMWIGDKAVYAAYLVTGVYVLSMVATSVLLALHITAPLVWMEYESVAVLHGEVWRVLTFGLINPPAVWWVVNMFLLAWFGRDVEKFFGRRIFLQLFGCLYLLCPLLFTLIGLLTPIHFTGAVGALAIFVAFAALYPGAVIWLYVPAKWAAIVLVSVYTLEHVAYRDLPGLVALWATCSFAFVFVRYQQGHWALPKLKRSRPGVTRPKVSDTAMSELDPLLDKIAASGFGSLTAAERAKLEAGRETLAKRNRPSRG